jgi:magnesium transporter
MRVALAMVPEVRELLRDDPAQLAALLEEIHDEDLADLLKLLDDAEQMKLLEQLDVEEAADIFERLDEHEQTELAEQFGAERLARIVSEMAPDDRTDFIEALPEEVGDRFMDTMHPAAVAEVEELMSWPEDTAGGLMTTNLIRLSPELTVDEVIDRIREEADRAETIYYVYGVEDDGTLGGIASLRELILARPTTKLRSIMSENVYTVAPETDQEEVANLLRKYDFMGMPVVDDKQRLLGLVTIDDVMDVVQEEQDEDVQRLAGVEPIEETYFQTTFWTFVRKRAPWLTVLFVGQFVTESVLRHYDPVLRAVTQLTYYLPLLMATGGNTGSQSATLIIRGLATGDVAVTDWWRVLGREVLQGLVLGALLATLGVLRVWWVGDIDGMAITIGLTVISVVLLGCLVGGMLPLLLRRLGVDPATSSTPFIATVVDVLGILLYIWVARMVLDSVISAAL